MQLFTSHSNFDDGIVLSYMFDPLNGQKIEEKSNIPADIKANVKFMFSSEFLEYRSDLYKVCTWPAHLGSQRLHNWPQI